MKFAEAIDAPKMTRNQALVATTIAAIFTTMAVSQLFAFEDYPQLITTMKLIADPSWSLPVGALVVIGEVFSLPFLLRMRLSPLMRVLSKYSGWLTLFYWFVVSLWQVIAPFTIVNSGFLGVKISILEGWSLLIFVVGVMVGFGYVGMPRRKK